MKRCSTSIMFPALASLMVLMPAQAGQSGASFQVSLRIVARPSAPIVSRQVISATSPGEPPHQVSKGEVVTEGRSGKQVIVITTTF